MHDMQLVDSLAIRRLWMRPAGIQQRQVDLELAHEEMCIVAVEERARRVAEDPIERRIGLQSACGVPMAALLGTAITQGHQIKA